MKLPQKLLYKWEKSVHLFFLLNQIVQLVIGAAFGAWLLTMIKIPSGPLLPREIAFGLSITIFIVYALANFYSIVFAILSRSSYFNKIAAFRKEAVFHYWWLGSSSIIYVLAILPHPHKEGVDWFIFTTLFCLWGFSLLFQQMKKPLYSAFSRVILLMDGD